MSETRQDMKSLQQDVRALRDEVKLKLHLAGMDLKAEWEKLEPQLDRAASSAAIVSGEVMSDLKKRLTEFRSRIDNQ
jgi:hypothetical protein